MCKALIRWTYHKIISINHIAQGGANFLKGGDIPRNITPPPLLRGGGESPGEQKSCDTGIEVCKMKAAASHFESIVALLCICQPEVGNYGHER
jgi:hypothetical protein